MANGARDENKNGLVRWFSKKRKPDQPAQKVAADNATASPARRTYVPRYAERDMIMSVPIAERPDLIARANERKLNDVCSDIGFSTGSQYSYRPSTSTSMTRSVSSSTAPSSTNGSRRGSPAPSINEIKTGRSAGASSGLKSTHRHYWQDFEGSPSARSGASSAHSKPDEQFSPHSLDAALHALDRPNAEKSSTPSSMGPRSPPNYSYALPRSVYTGRAQRPAYFSHHTIPDLRSMSEKGKGKMAELVSPRTGPYAYCGEARTTAPSRLRHGHSLEPDDNEASYVVRTHGQSGLGSGRVQDASKTTSSSASLIESTASEATTAFTDASKPSIASANTTLTEPDRQVDDFKGASNAEQSAMQAGRIGQQAVFASVPNT